MKSRYLPRKKEKPVKAIREMCIECMGGRENIGYKELIANCVSPDCALHDFRFGTNPYRSKLSLSDRERKARSGRAQSNFSIVLST
jgi:hypothetical protein